MRVCAREDGGLSPRELIADVLIDGVPTTVQLDTGADSAMVVGNSPVGQKLAARTDLVSEEGLSAAGKFVLKRAPNVPIAFAGGRWTAPVGVHEGKRDACGADGRVSMKQLRDCVLVIGTKDLRMRCQTPR